ncbi:hypothetical protein HN51_044077 [Arachis hypogaea]|uniref:Stigma-specific STIG1-like protein n=1 Tax=Arachis hypogaea TaxID=3818 RepID=A0A444Y4F0_ARAHY|nr:protein GRIM REAPER [Arachis ipaensis]XP_025672274.1 protein GRIM REAPER [Arachis hypogaea]QHN96221.1 Protein GRIM REAPER [Arachis hypogaea]RYQ96736.1 hypothetical protein Ahy_B08g092599 [Arachis hypogaea]
MANIATTLKFTIILSLLIIPLTLFPKLVSSTNDIENDDEDDEEYVVDTPLLLTSHKATSRFLSSIIIKKGAHCDVVTNNICNGIPANKGKGLLFCCKKHCRNVLSDRNNCGVCGHKCKVLGERCCNGVCTNVWYNDNHCGKCNNKCSNGDKCGNGFCGYA